MARPPRRLGPPSPGATVCAQAYGRRRQPAAWQCRSPCRSRRCIGAATSFALLGGSRKPGGIPTTPASAAGNQMTWSHQSRQRQALLLLRGSRKPGGIPTILASAGGKQMTSSHQSPAATGVAFAPRLTKTWRHTDDPGVCGRQTNDLVTPVAGGDGRCFCSAAHENLAAYRRSRLYGVCGRRRQAKTTDDLTAQMSHQSPAATGVAFAPRLTRTPAA